MIQVGEGPVRPGAGVNKDLPPVGTHHITGIVNVGGFMEYFVLQNTRLSLVMDLTDAIYDGISKRFPIKKTRKLFAASYEG
jgi:putative sporulation protein YyaC